MRKWFEIDNRGFTLMEILVTLIIASFVLMAIGSFVVRNIRYNAMANDQVYIQDQIRKTLKGMGSLIMDKKTVNINSTAQRLLLFSMKVSRWWRSSGTKFKELFILMAKQNISQIYIKI